VVSNVPRVVAISSLIGLAPRQGASSRLVARDQGAQSEEGGAVAVEMLRSCAKGSKTRIEWDTQGCSAYAVGAWGRAVLPQSALSQQEGCPWALPPCPTSSRLLLTHLSKTEPPQEPTLLWARSLGLLFANSITGPFRRWFSSLARGRNAALGASLEENMLSPQTSPCLTIPTTTSISSRSSARRHCKDVTSG